MKSYSKDRITTLEEVIAFMEDIKSKRDDDIVEFDSLEKQAGYTRGFKKTTLSVDTSFAPGINTYALDIDASSTNMTVTLALTPLDGQTHIVSRTDASLNSLTVDGNGHNINGASTYVFPTTQYASRTFTFMGGSGEWRITGAT